MSRWTSRILGSLRGAPKACGVAIDVAHSDGRRPISARDLLAFVRNLERRGIVVLAVGPSADLVTALVMEDEPSPLVLVNDLSQGIVLLRESDELGRRMVSSPEDSVAAIRAPARSESVAIVCRGLGERLAELGLDSPIRERLVGEVCDLVHGEILPACDPARDRLTISASVHRGRITLTILDEGSGPRRNPEETTSGPENRIHRFRVLGRHHAIVIERDLEGGQVA